KLAPALSRHAVELGKTQKILLQVHLGREATKFGLPPEQIAEVAAETAALPGIALQGLMGIAPNGEDARPFFRQLRRLFEALPAPSQQILSMGMTGDFETAIEEGATLVRIGTALFGARQ
ncbi:MAG: alanine racemase, partial [Armatimonadota bacterium]|nr:alanine racemase [Armatimonadota bacterium]